MPLALKASPQKKPSIWVGPICYVPLETVRPLLANSAEQIAAQIKSNVDDYVEGRISHPTFKERNLTLWDRANVAGVAEVVRKIVTPKLMIGGAS
jgi:hypothetical protein